MANNESKDGDGAARRHQRRSKPVKNLQEEVDLILSQEDSDDNIQCSVPVEETNTAQQEKKLDTPVVRETRFSAKRKGRKTVGIDMEKSNIGDGDASTTEAAPKTPSKEIKDKINELPKTPIDKKAAILPTTPSTSRILMTETPRRSARKSIRPPLDYDDIIEKKMLRSASKNTNDKENRDLEQEPSQQRWTKAEVGGVSQSRGRKSKRSAKKRTIEEELPEEKEIISKKQNKTTNSDDLSNDKEEEAAAVPKQQQKEEFLNEDVSQKNIKKRKNKSTTLSNDNEESSQKIIKKRNKSTNSADLSNVKEKGEALNEESSQKNIKKRNKSTNSEDLFKVKAKEEIIKKRNKSTNSKDLFNVKEEEIAVPIPKEKPSQNINTTNSTTNNEDLTNNEEMENEQFLNVEVERKGESNVEASLIQVTSQEALLVNMKKQLVVEDIVDRSSSIQKESSELILEKDEIKDSDMQMIEMKANKDDELDAVKEIIDLEETHTETIDEPSSSNVAENLDENTFGTFLKNNIIDLTDLGLEPIPIDASSIEMAPLIITDEIDDNEEKCNELNVTFDAEDIDKSMEKESQEENDCVEMQTLQLSDDDELEEVAQVKKPHTVTFKEQTNADTKSMIKVVLTDPDEHNSTLLKCQTIEYPSTPKSSKSYRLPTPYKRREPTPNYKLKDPNPTFNHKDLTPYKQKYPMPHNQTEITPRKQKEATPFKQNKTNLDIFNTKTNMNARSKNAMMNNLTTLEPKDIVLRSIRKRSKSLSINTELGLKGVTFYSPANQTLHIEELDKMMEKNVKKHQVNDSYVTKRRKRSLSLDDARMQPQKSRIPKLIPHVTKFKSNTPCKIRPGSAQKGVAAAASKPPTRTKMPNFAAIHEKLCNGMENLVEHVERKAKRAKILANSATKSRNFSAQKLQGTLNVGGSVMTPLKKEKPKASKKINMMSFFGNTAKPEQNPFAITKPNDEQQQVIITDLPKPRPMINNEFRFNQTRTVVSTTMTKSTKLIKKTTSTTTTTSSSSTSVSNSQTLKESNSCAGFGGVALAAKASDSTTKSTKAAAPLSFNLSTQLSSTSSSKSTYENKMAERRQRHLGMFKGRTATAKRTGGTNSSNANGEIIRGVRSNRRFELQMQHRRNIDQ